VSRWVALDWGTSSLRAALLDAAGTVLDHHEAPQGILHVSAGGFPKVFASTVERWSLPRGTLCLASGMVGSRQGWREAPYAPCPAGPSDLAARLAWIDDAPGGLRVGIVPGVSTDTGGLPDVLRGEEVQVLGALALLGREDGTFVLPGTHSKWVDVRGGRLAAFSTFMTGEVYGLLRRHSILARTMPEDDGPLDEAAFLQGVQHARRAQGLLHGAFSARTLALFDWLAPDAAPSYLSGLVIGEELRARDLANTGLDPVVVGNPALTRRYQLGLSVYGLHALVPPGEPAWSGLHHIARALESTQ
jgi:2-dehydro-3-deoxygalactonokinase